MQRSTGNLTTICSTESSNSSVRAARYRIATGLRKGPCRLSRDSCPQLTRALSQSSQASPRLGRDGRWGAQVLGWVATASKKPKPHRRRDQRALLLCSSPRPEPWHPRRGRARRAGTGRHPGSRQYLFPHRWCWMQVDRAPVASAHAVSRNIAGSAATVPQSLTARPKP
jgi:hypothetical protein